jgi:streptogramin lyase
VNRSKNLLFLVLAVLLATAGLVTAGAAGAAKPKLSYRFAKATFAGPPAVAPDGSLWFVGERNSNSSEGEGLFIGHLDGAKLTQFPVEAGEVAEEPIAMPDGAVLFPEHPKSEEGQAEAGPIELVEFTPDGQGRRFAVGRGVTGIGAMTSMDGELWFLGTTGTLPMQQPTIGRIAVSGDGSVQLYPIPAGCWPHGITSSPAGVWFGESCEDENNDGAGGQEGAGFVDRIDATGATSRTAIASGDAPYAATTGPEGTVWFGVGRDDNYQALSRVVRITATGELAEFRTPHAWAYSRIAVGADRRLWFVSSFGGQTFRALNSIGPAGHLGKPICIDRKCSLGAYGLTSGPDGTLWFSASTAHVPAGGGGSNLIEDEYLAKEPGYIWKFRP